MIKSLKLFLLTLAWTFPFLSMADSVDDFESYGNSTALNAAWVPDGFFTGTVALEGSEVFEGSQSMSISGTIGFPAVFITLYTFATAQDWSTATSVTLQHKGAAGNSPFVDITFQLLPTGGSPVIGSVVDTDGSGDTNWQQITLSLAGLSNLDDVKTIQIVLQGDGGGETLTQYFDDLQVNFPVIDAAWYSPKVAAAPR